MNAQNNDNRLVKIATPSGISCVHHRAKRTRENLTRWEFEAKKHELLMERLRLERRLERLNDR